MAGLERIGVSLDKDLLVDFDKLIAIQHSHLLQAISSLHVHLDHHDCLEIIVLRGQVGGIHRVGENILSMKGVKLGRINLVAT